MERQKDVFINELERQIKWERRWERLHRYLNTIIVSASWITGFLILALATYQFNLGNGAVPPPWFIVSLAILSTLNIALPLLSTLIRFQQRQEVHDRNAREYLAIKVEFLTDIIPLEVAVQRFAAIERKPTEAVIRQTP